MRLAVVRLVVCCLGLISWGQFVVGQVFGLGLAVFGIGFVGVRCTWGSIRLEVRV